MKSKQLKRPHASFMFNPREFMLDTVCLTPSEIGRMFLKVLQAVDDRDEAFLARYSRFIGRIYWRDATALPRPAIHPDMRRAVFQRDGYACIQCRSTDRLELDHYIPWSKGGQHTVENLRVLCKACNRRKAASMPVV